MKAFEKKYPFDSFHTSPVHVIRLNFPCGAEGVYIVRVQLNIYRRICVCSRVRVSPL